MKKFLFSKLMKLFSRLYNATIINCPPGFTTILNIIIFEDSDINNGPDNTLENQGPY